MHWNPRGNPKWITTLQQQFLVVYDIDTDEDDVDTFVWSVIGVTEFVVWLTSEGYKAEYWESSFFVKDSDKPIGYGIQFADDCPKLIEAKLRYAD
jgi:hypothetical protein